MDRWEDRPRLKADAELSKIPVLVISARAMPADEARAREAGCDRLCAQAARRSRALAEARRRLWRLTAQRSSSSTTSRRTSRYWRRRSEAGYETLSASNGEDALAPLENTSDLFLLDVLMAGMDGYELAAA